MLKKILYIIPILIILFSTFSFAADSLYRFTHNDQDAIIIGKVVKKDHSTYTIEVSEIIYSLKNMHIKDKPLSPNKISKTIELYAELYKDFQIGDNVVASITKVGNNQYIVKWGMYQTTTDNAETLKIIPLDKMNGDLKAIELFINSRGTLDEFSFYEEKAFVQMDNGSSLCIFPEEDAVSDLKIDSGVEIQKPGKGIRVMNMNIGNEFYVGWGTLALINAGLAQGKNRSGFNWFLLSLLLGPFATFCLLLCEKKKDD